LRYQENTSQSPTAPNTFELSDFHTVKDIPFTNAPKLEDNHFKFDKFAPTEYMDYTKPPKREEDYSNLNAGHPDYLPYMNTTNIDQ
jgi:hypothetical protein